MWLGGESDDGSDHQPLYVGFLSNIKGIRNTPMRAWSIRRPRIPTEEDQRKQLSAFVNTKWQDIMEAFKEGSMDDTSKFLARTMVHETGLKQGFSGGPSKPLYSN